jgi:hypothetical protein
MPPAYVLCWKEALLPFLLDTNQILAIEPMRHGDQCGDPALPVAGGIKKQTACAASESLCPKPLGSLVQQRLLRGGWENG